MSDFDEEIEDAGLDEEQALYEHHNIKVEKGQVTMRIDKFINIRNYIFRNSNWVYS